MVVDGAVNAVRDHHGASLPVDLARPENRLVEVVHDDLGLPADGVLVPFHVTAESALGAIGVKLRVVVNRLDEAEVAVDGGVAAQHVQNEPFLDGLFHGSRCGTADA